MTADAVFARPVLTPVVKAAVAKYGIAMAAIFFISFVLYLGLVIYNKVFVTPRVYDCNLNKDSLRSPKDKEDALLTFITKNRLG